MLACSDALVYLRLQPSPRPHRVASSTAPLLFAPLLLSWQENSAHRAEGREGTGRGYLGQKPTVSFEEKDHWERALHPRAPQGERPLGRGQKFGSRRFRFLQDPVFDASEHLERLLGCCFCFFVKTCVFCLCRAESRRTIRRVGWTSWTVCDCGWILKLCRPYLVRIQWREQKRRVFAWSYTNSKSKRCGAIF